MGEWVSVDDDWPSPSDIGVSVEAILNNGSYVSGELGIEDVFYTEYDDIFIFEIEIEGMSSVSFANVSKYRYK